MRYRQAKQNQPKDDKPETRESRFLDLMALHKEDLARRILDALPTEAEAAIRELQEQCDRHASTNEAISRQLADAHALIGELHRARDKHQRRSRELFKEVRRLRHSARIETVVVDKEPQ